MPGTHDTNIMLNFIKKIKNKNFNNISLPRFDKAIDDRFPKNVWYKINKKTRYYYIRRLVCWSQSSVKQTINKSSKFRRKSKRSENDLEKNM